MTPKYKQFFGTILLGLVVLSGAGFSGDCEGRPSNTTAKDEQALTEKNQRGLLTSQPPPQLTWSLERRQLINRVKLQNDRSIFFYLYIFIEGSSKPIGYYLVDKVSSVDSQLTNPQQLVKGDGGQYMEDFVMPSPSEDGSYGTNGNGVFGFTPDGVYLETNLKYVVSTIPLGFPDVIQLGVIHTDGDRKLVEAGKKVMDAK